MQSTTGVYFRGLDHIRALAAIAVYGWHITHLYVAPQYVPPLFLLSWLEEGHTGVSLFMVLSGYLFAKLADGRTVHASAFLWNRLWRLGPLFALMYVFYAIREGYPARDLFWGLVWPDLWPGLSWSIAVELQFYLLFPLLHHRLRALGPARGCALLLAIVTACLLTRLAVWISTGSVHYLAYWTLLGRADQLLMGMVFFECSRLPVLQRWNIPLLAVTVLAVILVFHAINLQGGVFDSYPQISHRAHWIWLPTFEGIAYGCAIACYDGLSQRLNGRLSGAVARIGELSYAIYMIHSMLLLGLLLPLVPEGTSLLLAIPAGIAFFPLVVLLADLVYRYVERPFFRMRRPYLGPPDAHATPIAPSAPPHKASSAQVGFTAP